MNMQSLANEERVNLMEMDLSVKYVEVFSTPVALMTVAMGTKINK